MLLYTTVSQWQNIIRKGLRVQGANTFTSLLTEAAQSSAEEAPLQLPPADMIKGVDLRIGAFNKAANNTEVANACNDCVSGWCDLVDGLIEKNDAGRKVKYQDLMLLSSLCVN